MKLHTAVCHECSRNRTMYGSTIVCMFDPLSLPLAFSSPREQFTFFRKNPTEDMFSSAAPLSMFSPTLDGPYTSHTSLRVVKKHQVSLKTLLLPRTTEGVPMHPVDRRRLACHMYPLLTACVAQARPRVESRSSTYWAVGKSHGIFSCPGGSSQFRSISLNSEPSRPTQAWVRLGTF